MMECLICGAKTKEGSWCHHCLEEMERGIYTDSDGWDFSDIDEWRV